MSNANAALPRSLGEELLRALWIFQGIAVLPIFLILGFFSVADMIETYQQTYFFITNLTCTIFSAGILYTVYLQRTLTNSTKLLTLRFEILKTVLAVALWVWLMCDAVFGPRRYGYPDGRLTRIKVAAISVVLLFLLFFPTIWYSHYKLCQSSSEPKPDEENGEREPLLQEQPQ